MGTSTTTIATMVIIMLCINIGLAFLQAGVTDLGGETQFMDVTNTPYNNYIQGGDLAGGSSLDDSYLPETATGETGSGDDFNMFFQANNWLRTSKISSALKFTTNLLSQPAGFLKDVGVPSVIATGFQVIWGIVFIFFLMAWILGR